MPSAPSASVPYGSLDEPAIPAQIPRYVHSMNPESQRSHPLRGNEPQREYGPEYGEHMRDTPGCQQDLVLDYLASLGFLVVNSHRVPRWFVWALVELLLGAYMKRRSQHVLSRGDTINHQRTTGIPCAMRAHFSPRQTVSSSRKRP
jgi:hypothetical protein